jgi:hypothetical protein
LEYRFAEGRVEHLPQLAADLGVWVTGPSESVSWTQNG